jgi:hypothetical protein
MDKTAIVYISDTHTNSTTGVCKPLIDLDEGGTFHPSRTQSWLYSSLISFVEQARSDTEGYRRVVGFGGDIGELDAKQRSTQVITRNKATIQRMIIETMEPILSIADATLVMRGTPAHEGKSSWLEEWFAYDISAFKDEKSRTSSWWQFVGECNGVRLDLAHHARPPGRRTRKGVGAVTLAGETMYDYRVEMKMEPPHVLIRSHNHQRADSGENFDVHVRYTRAWTSKTEYAYRIGCENALSDIGGLILFCEGASTWQIKEYPFYPAEMKQIWQVQL